MTDKELRRMVLDELDFEPSVDAAHIGVAVENGIVSLTGHVASYSEKLAAETAVRRVKGVHGIAEEIVVRYPADKKTADDEIAGRAAAIIAWDTQIPKGAVMVKVQKGCVALTGTVDWNYQKLAAEQAIRKLSGVVAVTNQISVKPRLQTADIKKRIVAALKRNADVEAEGVTVSVDGDRVKLEGKVKAHYERHIVEQAAWSVPGVRAVDDHLTLR